MTFAIILLIYLISGAIILFYQDKTDSWIWDIKPVLRFIIFILLIIFWLPLLMKLFVEGNFDFNVFKKRG